MHAIEKILRQMKANPANIAFSDLQQVCRYFFGEPRQNSGSHEVYKMPWPGNPRVNIQKDKANAKVYQVKQVLLAIERLKENQ